MFRRPSKNPLDDNSSIYEEESPMASPYKYSGVKNDISEVPPRLFDPARPGRLPPRTHAVEERLFEEEHVTTLPHHLKGIIEEEVPETTLGEGVSFRGELSFERLLRIDGTFEGELLSQGKVIVGPKGKVKANLKLREAVIEGEVEGNITVQEKLELRGEASIKGDIEAKSLSVDEGVRIEGLVQVIHSETTSL